MPETPDFDSMTPEEVTRWMESLAKRQGATEGLTTDADMEVEEVAEDDERLAGQGEYIPHGWTKEKWEAHLAKEEAEKQRKAAAQQAQPEPPPQIEPEPEPQPVAEADAGLSDAMEDKLEAAAEGDMPDFENMSPEEAMRFMESLAKRQGATEGFTTSADMDVEEVQDDDERLAGQGEYIPHGWTKEKWEAHLAKEEAEKQRKATAQQAQQPAESTESGTPQMPDILAGADMDDAPAEAADAPDFDDIFGGDNELPALNDMGGTADDTQPAASQEQNPMDWLSGLEDGDDDDLDLDALGELEGVTDDAEDGDPMDWLAGLAGDEEDDALDFDMGAFDDMDMGLDDEPAATADDMAFMDELDDMDDMDDSGADADADEGSLEWMETLAKRQGADSEELVTNASMDIPEADDTDERGPGYEPYSFESGTGMSADAFEDDDDEAISPPLAELDTEQLNLDDPESWLDSLASGVAASGADAFEDDDDEALTQDVTSKLRSGEDVSEDEIQSFFEAQFRRADKRDVPDYLDEDELDDFEGFDIDAEAGDGDLVEADIPEWLRESMDQEPPVAGLDDSDEQDKTATAEMMVQELGLDDDVADDEFPDWLAGADDEDSGDISDIFAEEMDDTPDLDTAASLAAEAEAGMPDDMNIDTDDSWVAAFSGEDSEELADWYQRERAKLEDEDQAAETASAEPAAGLEAADLPLETDLPQGQPQAMPQWMGSADTSTDQPEPVSGSMETEAVEGDLDWLTDDDLEGDADIPDWLREQVDDTVTAGDNVPDWLNEDDIDIDTDDVPDWLRETMDEEQEVIPAEQQLPAREQPQLPEPDTAQPAASIEPAAKSPAPVPVAAADIDVDSTLSAARESVTRDAVDNALHSYEQLIRANAALDNVENDLTKLTEKHRKNPAVFRLLGDAKMRQGKLQDALDVYRRALNML